MKNLLLSLFAFCSISTVFCQGLTDLIHTDSTGKKKKGNPRIRFHGGINFSGIGGESESYTGTLPGAHFGAGVNLLQLSDELGLDAGLGYSMQGSKYEGYQYVPGGEGGSTTNNSVRLNYLVMPLTAVYRAKNGLFGEAGIRPAILLSAKDKFSGASEDLKSAYKSFDMSLVIGAGYQFSDHIGIGAHYYPGIVNINKNSTVKDRNRNTSIGAYYRL
jgi:hypothetical protein